MYFYYEKLIPFTTLEGNEVILITKLIKGNLEFVDIGFPKGCNRLAKCKIYYNEYQIVPFNRDVWLAGNDITIRVPIDVQLDNEPYDLSMYLINLDDTYNHSLSFGISILTNKPITANDLAGLLSISTG